ncbi:DUF4984 domain-containing protein [Carboxylicivirga mesophila]|uniref:DUF4984 domain-containing protein n=1 Tax=Carboxylicivirga mesophila TaxID=1166478 RepID=A0ABS5KF42_9BACT|nr:DUF4984 domain-containing protein [Carboxylicivirga mesophila]MBS2213136.1 DUF4984 domain-containing protein [Carboxylicivirga mesophila]
MMRNIIFSILTLGLIILVSSCEKEKALYNGPDLAHFKETDGAFYIQDQDNQKFEILVGSTTVSSKERVVTLGVVEDGTTAVEGGVYTADLKVTIPAGEVFGKLIINGNYAEASPDGDLLKLEIVSVSDGEIADFKNTYDLLLYQFCPFNIDAFVGDAAHQDIWWFEDENYYAATLEKVDDTSVKVKNMFSNGNDIVIKFDDSDPANFVVTIDEQVGWYSSYYELDFYVKGNGTFSACAKTINYTVEHYNPNLGSYGAKSGIIIMQ